MNKIIEIVIQWQEDLTERFPYILERGLPLYTSDDTPHSTSFETYLKGELETYSLNTLALYYECFLEQKRNNVNASEIDLEHKINHYGYDSLEDANTILMKKKRGILTLAIMRVVTLADKTTIPNAFPDRRIQK